MDEVQGSSSALPPFITKTYEMVEDPSTDPIVSWTQSNKSFVVWSPPEFSSQLLPRFFKHNNFSSFIRQLNTYGFRKIDPEQWVFANEDFIRGQPHLLKNIHRRKPVHSHSMQNLPEQGASTSTALSDSERQGYRSKIERLKFEKQLIQLELQKHKQEQEGIESQAHLLSERLQKVGKRQKDVLSSLDRELQEPAFGLNTGHQSEANDRKRRLSRTILLYDDEASTSHVLGEENQNVASILLSNKESVEQLESSLTFWEDVLKNVGEAYLQQNSPLELDESTSCPDSPSICYTQLNVDVDFKTSEIDMNSEPRSTTSNNVPVVTPSDEQAAETAATDTVQTGANDVFWEQFLTENPGSSNNNVVEAQNERKDVDAKMNETKGGDHGKFWFSMRSVNNLAEQLGQLTPTETT